MRRRSAMVLLASAAVAMTTGQLRPTNEHTITPPASGPTAVVFPTAPPPTTP